jgi:hypothetical protein
MSIARQRHGKGVPTARNTQATVEELLEISFSVGSAPRLYNGNLRPAEVIFDTELRVGSREFSSATEA